MAKPGFLLLHRICVCFRARTGICAESISLKTIKSGGRYEVCRVVAPTATFSVSRLFVFHLSKALQRCILNDFVVERMNAAFMPLSCVLKCVFFCVFRRVVRRGAARNWGVLVCLSLQDSRGPSLGQRTALWLQESQVRARARAQARQQRMGQTSPAATQRHTRMSLHSVSFHTHAV
jgi:hypothetical protein